ncbi:DUF2530 domain-containing protein [Micromonospora arida]|uniref:DUF2530 domain-containing protein n=7 Tax=Micromonospora TaxID=1873 RepID=A0A3N9X1H3_9ACTN|nr:MULTISPECIES: DUF2530 domain-containing protein [Micromonospora]WTI08743.1 DUF2530 domain-containing protein [Micromonospora sp. NBC_00821]KAB1919160.1 DUF2530 domain-containing protein [Micromonospora noduli]MBG6068313.1 membrane protease YdiL (CAAX protease family) [Micromonospora ureilytica]MBQ1022097.1 DUF2530 domain-containing protein [Micromonospora sp. D93]MCG5447086.1 DUF2530 domain-containing protein [Micromonospora trifolii]
MPNEQPPRPAPLDPPMVPFALAGLIAWAVAGLVLLIFFRGWLTDHGHQNWLWTCLAGFLWGFPGLAVMMRHDANRRRRRAR